MEFSERDALFNNLLRNSGCDGWRLANLAEQVIAKGWDAERVNKNARGESDSVEISKEIVHIADILLQVVGRAEVFKSPTVLSVK